MSNILPGVGFSETDLLRSNIRELQHAIATLQAQTQAVAQQAEQFKSLVMALVVESGSQDPPGVYTAEIRATTLVEMPKEYFMQQLVNDQNGTMMLRIVTPAAGDVFTSQKAELERAQLAHAQLSNTETAPQRKIIV